MLCNHKSQLYIKWLIKLIDCPRHITVFGWIKKSFCFCTPPHNSTPKLLTKNPNPVKTCGGKNVYFYFTVPESVDNSEFTRHVPTAKQPPTFPYPMIVGNRSWGVITETETRILILSS